jgi:hypothetical protein
MRTARTVRQPGDAVQLILLEPLVATLAADAETPADIRPRALLGRELLDQI